LIGEGEPMNNPVIVEPERLKGIRFLDFLKTFNWTDTLKEEVQSDFINSKQESSCEQRAEEEEAVNLEMMEHPRPFIQPVPEFITYPPIDKAYKEPMDSCSKP
jgi:hypothetical protein